MSLCDAKMGEKRSFLKEKCLEEEKYADQGGEETEPQTDGWMNDLGPTDTITSVCLLNVR